MSAIIDVAVPATDFELGRSLQSTTDGARFELERMVPTTDRIIPYLWVHDADFEALDAHLAADQNVLSVALLDDFGDRALFRIEWPATINGLVKAIRNHEAAVLEALGTRDRWEFQLRFPDSADISAFRADCEHAGVTLDLKRLYHPDEPDAEASGLTPVQRETLLTALEEGYFAIPRHITMKELADQMGISDQTVSERLRRGQTTVFTSLLLADATVEDD